MQYLKGKHIALAVAAFLIILVGVPYTLLLFLWQWLIRASKLFRWTMYARLIGIFDTYQAPYNYILSLLLAGAATASETWSDPVHGLGCISLVESSNPTHGDRFPDWWSILS